MRIWIAKGVVPVAFALVVAGCSSGPSEDARRGADAAPGAEPTRAGAPEDAARAIRIARLPTMLTALASSPDGRDLVVATRTGVLYRLVRAERDGVSVPELDPTPLVDLSPEVSVLGERGFFDLRFTPDGRWLLGSYTALDGTVTVTRFPYDTEAGLEADDRRTIFEVPAPYAWHHGGGLALEADGDLLVSIGDLEFRQLDPPGPQDPDLLLGGVVRIPAEAVIGSSLPWTGTPDDLVAKGLRNPWRISVDRATGDLWIGDVGNDTAEEVNRVDARRLGGTVTNFGWPYVEGTTPGTGTAPEGTTLESPVLARPHEEGTCGVVGGYRYRGRAIPSLVGRYLYGDLCSPELRSFDPEDGTGGDRVEVRLAETPVALAEGHDGELYVLGAEGSLLRLDPESWSVDEAAQGEELADAPAPTVQRSREDCDGIVGVMVPLSDMESMDPVELEATFTDTLAELELLVPALPDFMIDDGQTVLRSVQRAAASLNAAGWDTTAGRVPTLRADLLAGRGDFEGFPEAMARIVDSECG